MHPLFLLPLSVSATMFCPDIAWSSSQRISLSLVLMRALNSKCFCNHGRFIYFHLRGSSHCLHVCVDWSIIWWHVIVIFLPQFSIYSKYQYKHLITCLFNVVINASLYFHLQYLSFEDILYCDNFISLHVHALSISTPASTYGCKSQWLIWIINQ